MKILLHICCGPCTIYPLQKLRADGHSIRGFFYNPNIHPFREFQQRLDCLEEYAASEELPMIIDADYALDEFLRQVSFREGDRCRICYGLRLRKAAQIAKKGQFEAFTTTLLVSPQQKHALIRDIGLAVGQELGVPFYYEDFRPGYFEAALVSKKEGLYRQQYCGCVYSERDRYQRNSHKKKDS